MSATTFAPTPNRPYTLPFAHGFMQYEAALGDRDFGTFPAVQERVAHLGYNQQFFRNAPLVLPALTDNFVSFTVRFTSVVFAKEFLARLPKSVKARLFYTEVSLVVKQPTETAGMGLVNETGEKRAHRFYEVLTAYLTELAGQEVVTFDPAAEKAASGVITEEYRVLEAPTYGLQAGDPLLDPNRDQTHRVLDLLQDEDGVTVYQGTENQCEIYVARKEAQGFHGIDFEVGPNPYHRSNLLAPDAEPVSW